MDMSLERLRSLIAWEDTFLALVALAVVPVLNAVFGGSAGTGSSARGVGPITGLFVLVAIGGVIACLFTRGPGEPPPLGDGGLTFQGWARFPLAAGVAIVAIDTLPSIGLPSGAGGVVFLAVAVSAFAHRWLPVIPVATRRLFVLPMGMVGAGAFNRIIGSNLPHIMGLVTRSPKDDPTRAFLPLIVAAVLMVYVMLVVAPRSVADPEARWWPWIVRFGLLLAAAALGNTVVGALVSW
ncbi:MAG TPA: hypothetical protein VL331_10210 [Croceibacterium sp.]|jgi:hypothetical protein|nr:hypothetical protein [Croceibacterium sp.]